MERLKKGVLIVLFTGCSFLLPCARHSKVEDVLPERGCQPCLSRRLSFFFGFFPSPSATHAILAESLGRSLARTCMTWNCSGNWRCSCCGCFGQKDGMMTCWELGFGRRQENGRFRFSAGFAWTVWFVTDCTSTATVRVCLLNVSKPIVEHVEHK